MIQFNNTDKRWLEIIFYLLCRKIATLNQKQSDLLDFIKGYRWTNMFDYDKLISLITKNKILLDPNIPPSKHEFLITMEHPDCRLRIDKRSVRELIKGTEYTFHKHQIFHAKMKEEVNPTEIFPKLNEPNAHETIYSFLLSLRYIAELVKKIKF